MLTEHTQIGRWQFNLHATPHSLSLSRISRAVYPVLKRSVDLVASAVLLVLLAPLMMAIAVAIRLDSPGPIIYVQRRCGVDGRVFRFYKFRSMTNGHDHTREHREFAAAYINGHSSETRQNGDGRRIYKPASHSQTVTRVGAWLRHTSLDELPQLINVLLGDMSLVGPRPSIDYEVEMYTDWHRQRLAVLPGLTGWAQINGRSTLGFDEIVRLDMEYIVRRSLLLDLTILARTVVAVLRAEDVG